MNDKNTAADNITCFSFGGIEVVNDYLDLLTCYDEGDYYNPPVNLNDLTKLATRHVNAHHPSALQTKKNVLVSTFQPTPILSVPEFEKFVMSYLTLGNAYFEVVYDRAFPSLIPHTKHSLQGDDIFSPSFSNVGSMPFLFCSIYCSLRMRA